MTEDEGRNKRFKAAQREVIKQRTAIQRETAKEITRLLKVSLDKVTAALAAQPSDYQQWALPPLKQSIQRTLHELSAKASAAGEQGMVDAWGAGKDVVDAPLTAGGINLQGIAQSMDTRQLFAMREFMTVRIQDISVKAMNRINSELGLIITGIQSPSEAVGNIAWVLNETSRRRAMTIVRTELGRAFSVASHERSVQAKDILPGLKKQWRRSGKTHSRPAHDAADGQIQEVDKPFTLGNGIQLLHPLDPAAPASETINCGCVALDYMAHWEMSQPGAKPFSADELARKRAAQGHAVASGHTLAAPRRSGNRNKARPPVQGNVARQKSGRRVQRVIAEYENKWAGLPVENAVIISKSGEVLAETAGSEMQVGFTRSELRKMRGAIVLHNHPDVASFSKDDIATAATQRVAEIRVVDAQYTYSMKPAKGGWNKTLWQKIIEPAMVDAGSKVYKRMRKAEHDGKMTQAQFDADHYHEVWEDVAKQTGIIYRRQKRQK